MAEKRKQIGRYKVLTKLGKGGMGTVYKVESPVTGKAVALKLLDPFEILLDIVGEQKVRQIFTTEAVLMAQLRNPYITEVWDFDYDQDGLPFFTMEYYCNNLGTMIGERYHVEEKSRLISPEKVLNYGSQILTGLSCLHGAGIIHRDIKPFNIMISDLDTVKICDFGLSKQRGEAFPGAAGMRIGSPFYTAPEQERDPDLADERSDLYSVGVLLYRMLSGELPSMKNISLSMVNHLYDEKWDKFFARVLSLRKEERFASASEMLAAIKHLHLHWENVKEQACAIADLNQLAHQEQRTLRCEPVRVSGKNARNCFGIDTLLRPKEYIRNNFAEIDNLLVEDKATGLIWQLGCSDNPLDRQGADQYIAALNLRKFAGISSWRLPTVNEILSLCSETGNIEKLCQPVIFEVAGMRLWSCDWRSDRTAWYVNMELEFVSWQDVSCFYYVRGVCSAG